MKMKKLISLLPVLALAFSAQAFANATGFVTPSEMTITFTRLSLIKSDNKQLTLLSGTYPTTFKKSTAGFSSVSLSSVIAPAGRFVGVQVCYNTARTVKVSGDVYEGTSGSISNGATLYSHGSDALVAGAVDLSPAANTTVGDFVVGNGSNNCSSSYFGSPVCVTSDASLCTSGDSIVNAGTSVPNLNLLLDLYHSVGVDASNGALDNHIPVYPYPTIGTPGAAFHLKGGAVGNITLLFAQDKKLLYSASYGAGSSPSGTCSGNGFVSVSAGPSGAFINSYGPTAVQSYNSTSGKVQFAAGNSGSGNNSVSNGIVTIDSILHAVGTTVNVTCVADSAADPAYLGYTYSTGSGVSGASSGNYTIQRITDPNGVFASSTGCTGTCVPGGGDTVYPAPTP